MSAPDILHFVTTLRRVNSELPAHHAHALLLLSARRHMTIRELRDHLQIAQSSMSRLAAVMCGHGLVWTQRDPHEPRRLIVGLTDRGRHVMDSALDPSRQLEHTAPQPSRKSPKSPPGRSYYQ